MARAAVKKSAWLICSKHSFNFPSSRLTFTLPTDPARTTTKMAGFSSAAAYFLIFNRGFYSNAKASDSGNTNLWGKDQSRTDLTALLKSYDFSELQIDNIIKKFPRILLYRVSTNLKPKLDYFVECGFSGSVLHRIFASNPQIFSASLDSTLKPRYQYYKTYFKDKGNVIIKRHAQLLCSHNAETNIEYLKKLGVPVSSISKLLEIKPQVLCYSRGRLVQLVDATKKLGIEPGAAMFVWYLWVFGSMNKTSWKKKLEVFKSLGWSDEDVKATLLHYPSTFRVSEEKLRRMMQFYLKNMKAEPRDVIAAPKLLMYSLDGRIVPRYEVMKLLKEYNLWGSCKITAFFDLSEKRFMKRYVEKNLEQVPHLLRVYCDSRKAKAAAAVLNS